jgi:hypothetical protein
VLAELLQILAGGCGGDDGLRCGHGHSSMMLESIYAPFRRCHPPLRAFWSYSGLPKQDGREAIATGLAR